jgi:DNA-directed RNA polymerase subunit RPC12/RpoP
MDKVYIKGLIQNILNKEFSNQQKRRIDEYADRLNMACPYCGDSSKSVHKKRGNLYFNKLFYICFNCDKKTSLDRLAKDFNEAIDPQKKLEIIEYLDSVVDYSDYDTDFNDFKLDDLFDIKDLEELFNVKDTTPIFDFKPISDKSGVFKYLIGRGIPKHLHKDIYQAKYSKGDEGFEHVIIFLNRRGDKVLGLQVRNLKEGRRRFFVIYNWESIYKWFHGDDVELDIQKSVIYNKLSYFFNILNVNFENTITIFEGFLDSLFYPNSVGIVGVNTDLRFLENNNLDLQYFFDNDIAGYNKSEEKLLEGGKIFLWKKLFEDIVSKKKSDDPHKLLYRISKVKDLNKLNELVPESFKKLGLSNFFSEDLYDLKYLPKKSKKKVSAEKDYLREFKNHDF